MTQKSEIEQEIAALKQQMKEVKGTKTEVYSRVCGYLRPTASWNKGKKEEFTQRKTFRVDTCCGE